MIKTLFAGALLLIAGIGCSVLAQEEAGAEDGGREQPRTSLRGWIFGADENDDVMVAVATAGEGQPSPIASSKDGATVANAGYTSMEPGNRTVELRFGEDVLASQTAGLREGLTYTAIAWKNGSKWELKLFADSAPSANAPDRPLRVINFAEGRETLLSVDGGNESKVAGDTVQEFRMPRKIAMVMVKVLAPDGSHPAMSSVEVDFNYAPSAYVVVSPDYRGRMRPRVILGGDPPPEDPVAVGEAG